MIKDKLSISEAINKLIELTKNNKLKWGKGGIPHEMKDDPDIKILSSFQTMHNQRVIRLVEFKIKKYGDYESFSWENAVKLELVDRAGFTLWEFPDSFRILDLLEAIKYQFANVDDFIKDLFAND